MKLMEYDSSDTLGSQVLSCAQNCGSMVKNLLAVQETLEMWVQSLGWEDLLEKGMATHFSILA